MLKIGSGWQVFVYEYSKNRVYKKVKKPIFSALKIIKDMPFMVFRPLLLLSWANKMSETHLESLDFVKNKISIWKDLGRPIIEANGNYYQDRVIPLHQFLKDADDESALKIIDDAISLSYKLYKEEGFIDKSFNILINFGVIDGRVILSDIGELFHGESMVSQINKRPWYKPYVLRFHLMKHKKYFVEEMDKKFLGKNEDKV